MKPITRKIYNVLQSKGFEDAYILEITKSSTVISVSLQAPINKELSELEELLPNIQQELKAIDYKVVQRIGKRMTVLFGSNHLGTTEKPLGFNNKYIHPNTLKLELPSAFGSTILDFEDGASCHMLNGGAPRMGKTIFLLYLSTTMYLQTNGNIQLYITSPKSKDFYPLFNIPNVTISQDETEFMIALDELITEYKYRNQLLYSPEFEKATDTKTVRQFYPNKYHLFKPIFFIIDEYARFSHIKPIQLKVAELVQTAGYVNVHVIIATQRPDARNTLPANIKMGLMARICFKTADKNNSIVILDEEGAETLPNEKGRAILKDGENNIIQVPYLTYDQCSSLLQPYKKERLPDEPTPNKEIERSENNILANKIQDMFKESASLSDFQEQLEPNKRLQQNNEKIVNGWMRLASKTIKG